MITSIRTGAGPSGRSVSYGFETQVGVDEVGQKPGPGRFEPRPGQQAEAFQLTGQKKPVRVVRVVRGFKTGKAD